jgi:hypothetical protein
MTWSCVTLWSTQAGSVDMVGKQAPEAPRRGLARRPSSGRRLWPLLAAIALLALAAVGSLRRPPGSGAGTPHFPTALVQTLGLLALIAVVAGAAVGAWALLPAKGHEIPRRPRNPFFMPMMLVGIVLVLGLMRRLGWLERLGFPGLRAPPAQDAPGATPPPSSTALTGGEPAWVSFAIVGVLLAGLAAAMIVRRERARRRRAALSGPGQHAELHDHTLAGLEDESDPRRAVIAAWIRMEGGLSAAGLPRRPSEAPLEYVARVLESANVRPESVRRLADLFERAKFSQHAIDERMRAEAIEAVTIIRAELQAELEAQLEAERRAEDQGTGDPPPEGERTPMVRSP